VHSTPALRVFNKNVITAKARCALINCSHRQNSLKTFAILFQAVRLLASTAASMLSFINDGLVVHNFWRKCIYVALLDAFHGLTSHWLQHDKTDVNSMRSGNVTWKSECDAAPVSSHLRANHRWRSHSIGTRRTSRLLQNTHNICQKKVSMISQKLSVRATLNQQTWRHAGTSQFQTSGFFAKTDPSLAIASYI
jgi:hypothetical protein